MRFRALAIAVAAVLFAVFPLTDTDIWWHLACAREWVVTWTPVREPVVHIHEFYQQFVSLVYGLGGAPALVTVKAVLWGVVFFLFCCGTKCAEAASTKCAEAASTKCAEAALSIVTIFLFRYQLEARPVLFSMLFLGAFWNLLPRLGSHSYAENGPAWMSTRKAVASNVALVLVLLFIQWIWCRSQGLYVLGPILALVYAVASWRNVPAEKSSDKPGLSRLQSLLLVAALWAMPFLHGDGLNIFLFPFGLLDRLLGLTPSAALFASGIAENRSPITLFVNGENSLEAFLMAVLSLAVIVHGTVGMVRARSLDWRKLWMVFVAVLALVAERNFVLLLPLLVAYEIPAFVDFLETCGLRRFACGTVCSLVSLVLVCGIFGFWVRSLLPYDASMVSYQRVPVRAAAWMKANPHGGRLFNDDRAGGYLAFVNPDDSVFVDGRFILKTSEFFGRYLQYAHQPELFLGDADSLGMDRAVFPIRYYARWGTLVQALERSSSWSKVYVDSFYVVFDRADFQ